MPLSTADTALGVCEFIRSYNTVWAKYFPDCAQRGHWQIAQIVRTHENGLVFSEIKSRLGLIYGMDEDTCVKRTLDLLEQKLIEIDGKKLGSQTEITATAALVDRFDHHTAEVAELLCATAKQIDPKVPRLRQATKGAPLNRKLTRFFEDFLLVWNEHRERFLEEAAKHPAHQRYLSSAQRRRKANKDLRTGAYWHILITAWTHRHNLEAEKRRYLLVEKLHVAILDQFEVSVQTTAGYVTDMCDWGILDRLKKVDGGDKRNKFAVCLSEPAYAMFTAAFCQAAPILVSAAYDFIRLSADSGAKVLPFRDAG
jgi:hypothetical protein